MTITLNETEAAALEGFVPATDAVVELVKLHAIKRAALDAIEAEMKTLKEQLEQMLDASSAEAFTHDGKSIVRRDHKVREGVDAKRLRKELPSVFESYKTSTSYTSTTIAKGI